MADANDLGFERGGLDDMRTNRKEIYVERGDCDPGGVVYCPNYLDYGAACTNALFERAGLPKQRMIRTYGIVGIPMVDLRARVLEPCQYGDTIMVESYVSEWGKTSFSVHHKMWNGDVLAAEIFEKHVWVAREDKDSPRFKGKAIPQEVKDRLSNFYDGSRE
ncbi:MAG TPA: acyl-CoA thioesterase [Candidatus Polarisedimenticolia bacterium]|nr:acyl-CoA thioesterase [Candidatus Polarisedimenticolia bacterium]